MLNQFNIRDILNKKIICLDAALLVGTVSGLNFDNEFKAQNIYLTSMQNPDQVQFVSLDDVWCIGEAILIKYSHQIKNVWNTTNAQLNCPINAQVYDNLGNYTGKLIDVEIKNKKIESLQITGKPLKSFEIMSVSNQLVLINTSFNKIKFKKNINLQKKIPKPNVVTLD